ncbi:MAG: hypothetical protein KF729_32200 [Sandaracinaceae bacterium]|nr:hypothetical protein [Sandaracinaceae bacterium]
MKECRGPSDCRPGYFCGAPAGATVGYCVPIDCDVPGLPACPTGSSCQTVFDGTRRCVMCRPDCTGRTCGSDGCGGSCGSCGPNEFCGPGTCVCAPESDAQLCTAASTSCGTIEAVDRCGVARTPSCGSCTPPMTCGETTPGRCGCTPESVETLCAARGATCGTVRVTDRCGATRDVSCGTCTLPQTCGGGGVPNRCGVCTPSCGSRVCGNDGCGGSCGTCESGMQCNSSGQCEPIPCDPVMNTRCAAGQRCEWDSSGNICISAGPGRSGDSCFFVDECAAEHTCTGEGLCREYCTTNAHCRVSGAVCAHDLAGSSYGLCSRPCDPIAGTGCRGFTDRCRLFNAARATEVVDCGPTGSRTVGSPCTSVTECAGGACVGGTCRRVCHVGTSCSPGMCASVPGWFTYGVCP